jgi:GH25 family lysozyme M1 (1,4-beta-N-acetylmuramidase)/fibronectin type 3 domain-containing protein
MRLIKEKIIGAGIALAAALCFFAPQRMNVNAAQVEQDGVMGQSLVDETDYHTTSDNLDSLILKAAARTSAPSLLSATASTSIYTPSFLGASFTTEGAYTSATYYHLNDYENYTMFNGIDVSWHQSTGDRKTTALDWSEIHDAGIDFAFVRVASRDSSDGKLYEDTCADSHIQEALDNDVNVGLYVFSQALTQAEAREEANYVLALLKKYGWDVTLPIVLDREAGTYKRLTAGSLSKTQETAVCQAFADTITAAGYEACVYASYTWINSYINTSSLKNCSLWIARYNNTTTSNSKSGTAYSDLAYDYEFWQYSSIAKVSGYTGNLDVDFWYKDTSAQTTDLAMTANTATSASLSWSAAGDAMGYRVYRYDTAQKKYVYLASTTKKSYTDSTLASGTEYQYKVRGYWTIGGTKYFGAYSSVLTAATKPAQTKNVAAETGSSTSVNLAWSKVTGATGYQIYRLNASTGKYEKAATVKGVSALSYTDAGLATGTEYQYKVRAYKTSDGTNYFGSFSTVIQAVTKPAQVKSLKLSTASSAITLTWGKVSGATGYQIYRLNTTTGKYEKVKTVKGAATCTYKNTGLKKGKAYTYKVRAYMTYNGKNYFGGCSAAVKLTAK